MARAKGHKTTGFFSSGRAFTTNSKKRNAKGQAELKSGHKTGHVRTSKSRAAKRGKLF